MVGEIKHVSVTLSSPPPQGEGILDESSGPPPMQTSSAHKIERAAQRDPVGESVPAGNTAKCVFSGHVIEIEVKQMTETGIRSVECPKCLATRTFTRLADVMHFPTHD